MVGEPGRSSQIPLVSLESQLPESQRNARWAARLITAFLMYELINIRNK